MAVAPYPHIKMGVRDESIYIGLDTEILPLDKPLYMVKAQKGEVGKPIWCPTYTKACQVFGTDTFNKRSKYWSEASYFLLKTLTSNGAFIMRVADENAKCAKIYIECGIKNADVPQWKRNEITGQFALDNFGERIGLYRDASTGKGLALKDDDGEAASGATVTAAEAGPVMGETADTSAIVSKQYYSRDYAEYVYTPYRADTAAKDMVAYKGTGTAVPTEYTKATLTAAIIANNYVFTKNTENAYELCENLTLDNVASDKMYYTLKYPTYIGQVFRKNDVMTDNTTTPDEAQVGVWFTRTPNLAAGFSYSKINTTVTGFVAGDKFTTDGLVTSADGSVVRAYVGQVYEQIGNLIAGNLKEQATIPGIRLVWRAIVRITEDTRTEDSTDVNPQSTGGYTWYPMMSFVADTAGEWGQAFGFRFFYDKANNTLAGVEQNGAVKYSLAPVELKSGDTTPVAIVNAYGEQVVVGTIKEGVIDPTTDLEVSLSKLVPAQYSGSRELPCSMTLIPESFATIGKKIMEKELAAKDAIKALYDGLDYFMVEKDDGTEEMKVTTFVEDLMGSKTPVLDDGHMANLATCVDPKGVPYFASYVMGTDDPTTTDDTTLAAAGAGVINVNDDSWFHLLNGTDGAIGDADIERFQRYQIDACVAGTQDYLIDYLRCPYNNIIDTGVSLKTKKSYLDFMGVRDNLTVFLTPQQLWKNADGTYPAQLSRYEDESVGAVLRSYGLLMREDVENATEANRCIIFLASGINSDHDYANEGLVASTLWIALKNAEYLNKTYIDKEPVERPNSEIKCYDGGMTWTAASEETRSRCWNAGLNYAQYCEQTVIHYASVRSIYRYDTSVLCDLGTVRAVTFCKDIIRREWAIWAGSKRKAEDLNGRITKALNEKLAAMLNNKYTFSVKVYQTDEDKKYGYVRHVDLELTSPAQNRVWLATIICKREGFDPNAEEAEA